MTDPKARMFDVRMADLPKYAFNATAFVFICGLAAMAAHAAWSDRTSDLSGGVWALFASFAVMCMAAAAHTLPRTWMRRERGWFAFFCILLIGAAPWAFYFDFVAISTIFDKAAVVQTTQHKTRVNREKTESELSEELRRINDQLKVAMTLVDNGVTRPVRPLKTIEADGRFLASNKCTNIDPKSAGQRTVCQEHSFADDRAKKEKERDQLQAQLIAQRDRLETTAAVVSDDVAGTKRIAQVMGWSKEATALWLPLLLTVLAEILAVLVPLAAGYVTHSSHEPALASPAPATSSWPVHTAQADTTSREIHLHVNAPTSAAPDQDGMVSRLNPITGQIEFQRVIPIAKPN